MPTPTANRRYSKPTEADRILLSIGTFLDEADTHLTRLNRLGQVIGHLH